MRRSNIRKLWRLPIALLILALSYPILSLNVVARGKPPVWTPNSLHLTAVVGTPFTKELFEYVKQSEENLLSFKKISGPPWLSVSGGSAAGTPLWFNAGENHFTIAVCNGDQCLNEVLTISVAAKPERIVHL